MYVLFTAWGYDVTVVEFSPVAQPEAKPNRAERRRRSRAAPRPPATAPQPSSPISPGQASG